VAFSEKLDFNTGAAGENIFMFCIVLLPTSGFINRLLEKNITG
jgi:hypothetical protein